jgi:phage repressor protein C with HTH and peptisase S24 domain
MYYIQQMHETMKRLYQAAKEKEEIEGQSDLAKRLNQSPQTLNNWEARGMSKAGILLACKELGIDALWLESGEEVNPEIMFSSSLRRREINLKDNPEYPAIRRVNLKLSAGQTGFAIEYDLEDKTPISFSQEWFNRNNYRPEKLIATKVNGQSMEPGLYEDDTVVINTADIKPIDGVVFAVNYEGELLIKRLVRDMGMWWITSDNPDQRRYPRKECAGESCIILGRIVHKQSEHI